MNPCAAPRVRSFRQILFWPVQLCRPNHLDGSDSLIWLNDLERFLGKRWKAAPENNLHARYEDFVYFHRFVQRFLYGGGPNASVRRLEWGAAGQTLQTARVVLTQGAEPIDLKVSRATLYLFATFVAILVVELNHEGDLDLHTCQNLLDTVRRAYPPYWGPNYAGHCPHSVEWHGPSGKLAASDYEKANYHRKWAQEHESPPVAAHWRFLLCPLAPRTKDSATWAYEHIQDERMPAMAYLAFDHPEHLTKFDFARLALLAEGGDSLSPPYSPSFLEGFEQYHCYDRFWQTSGPEACRFSTRYLFGGYSMVAVGSASPDGFFATDGLRHFRNHYFRMGLIAFMQHASLLVFFNRLYHAVDNLNERENLQPFRREIRTCSLDFAAFTSRFWATGVTNHLQGREMFDIWLRNLGTVKLYEETKQQFEYVHQVLETEATGRLAQLAAVIGLAALVIGLAGISFGLDDFYKWLSDGIQCGRFTLGRICGFFVTALLLILICVFVWSALLPKSIRDLAAWDSTRSGDKPGRTLHRS